MEGYFIQFGNGAWGQNHNRILKGLGYDVVVYDIDSNYWEVLDELFLDPDLLGVIVTTTSENHWPIAKLCMELKVPVFCEKPVLLKDFQLKEMGEMDPEAVFMAGHQLVFMPEVREARGKDIVYMNSLRSGAIPRSEGSLFSLMVHDISVAHYVMNEPEFECTEVEGNKHEIKATLRAGDKTVELYAVSIANVRLRHTTFVDRWGEVIHLNPDNWARPDLLDKELYEFVAAAKSKTRSPFSNLYDAYKVMNTVFKIQNKLHAK